MSNPLDSPFMPRPWPARQGGQSPLSGRRVLVVDDDLEHAREVGSNLTRLGVVSRAVIARDMAQALDDESWTILLADGASMEGLEWPTDLPVCAFTPRPGEPPTNLATSALAFVPRQPSQEELSLALGRVFERADLDEENRRLRRELQVRGTFGSVITRDPSMKEAMGTLSAVAETRANVLLLGESGTGKSRLAEAVHQASDRADGPFIVVNCGAIPDNLLESELFGHVKGAFSGAMRDREGRFEQAGGGTIFLDEINSASLDLQVKLLRVLQDHTFERVGSGEPVQVDIRLIAASNADLPAEIEAGRFREDLYWRLHVVAVELPPLRDRPGDVALLAEHFLARYAADYHKPVRALDPDTLALLAAYDWPGNVRQLENVLERAVLMSSGRALLPENLGAELQPTGSATNSDSDAGGSLLQGLENLERLPPLKEALEGPERQILIRALELTSGNRSQASEMLGINRTTLFNKMRKYGLMDLSFEPAPKS